MTAGLPGPLRPVEAMEIEHEGQPMILVRDPEGLLPDPIVVPLPMFMIATLFDGKRNAREIQELVAQASGGQIIPAEQLEKIAEQLDQLHLFENERTRQFRVELEQAFEEMPVRPAVHAGTAYPDDPTELTEMFNEMFSGLAGAANGARPRGLVTPHIDMRLGGRLLAEGLARVKADAPPRLYIILGVAHHPTRNLFSMTDKDFETPLGIAETDKEAAGRLRELYGAERLSGGLAHAGEHSIEFPVVALKYWHAPAERPFKILPILCSMLPEERGIEEQPSEAVSKLILPDSVKAVAKKKQPSDRPEVREFVDALKTLIKEYAGEVVIIASVDLAHVGLKFGEQEGVDETRALEIRQADEKMLQLIGGGDAEAWFEHFRTDKNSRNVDAVTSVYILMQALGTGRYELIGYDQWKEEPTDSMVTFASAALY